MRRLFLKTFLWFWLILLVTTAAVLIPNIYAQYALQSSQDRVDTGMLSRVSRDAVEAYERGGEIALFQYAGQLQRDLPVQAIVFRKGEEVIGPRLDGEPSVRVLAQMASSGYEPIIRGTLAAQRVISPSGKMYVVVLRAYRNRTALWRVWEAPLMIVGAGALFCFLITRHVTAPLFKLRAAAAAIADGRLDTRVGPALGRRADEIADLARDFDRMAERIESLLAGQKRLLADVSHELRSPLARLSVALNLARNESTAGNQQHLERIQLEARRLDQLIDQLLMLSRIDGGVQGTERVPVDFARLVQEVASDADFEARPLSRHVTVECSEACTVSGSEEVLRSAVENVVRNAVRHTSEGTSVEVKLGKRDSSSLLCVRDHGAGVPEPMLSEIFLPFRKAHATQANGAGLGLAITERAVRAHGGSVRAQNAPEGGLSIEITLPLA